MEEQRTLRVAMLVEITADVRSRDRHHAEGIIAARVSAALNDRHGSITAGEVTDISTLASEDV